MNGNNNFHCCVTHLFSFVQLNKVVTGPRHPGVIGDRGSGSFSRESEFFISGISKFILLFIHIYIFNLFG